MAELARWQATIVDASGDVQPLASIEVRREIPGQPLVELFSDRAGLVPIANPGNNPFLADSEGFAFFHVAGGAYKITATLGGFTRIWRYVAIGRAQELDVGGALGAAGTFTGDGVTTAFDLGYGIGSLASILWVEDGIVQRPGIAYLVSGSVVTRTTAPLADADIFWMLFGAGAETDEFDLKVDKIANGADFDDPLAVPANIGLGNVDNTSDANKPVSTAQQTALDLKAPLASPTLTGVPAAPTAAAGTNTTQIATTAHVLAERTNAATLTNKTLTAPVVNSPTGIVKGDVGLGNVDNTSDVNKPVSTAQAAAIASAVVGLFDDRGSYNASVNTFPASGGSGTAGAILKGDIWLISVAGTLGGAAVSIGDQVRALVDTPGQTASNWAITEANIVNPASYVVGPASVTDDLPAIFDGTTGKLIKQKTYAAFKTLLALVKGDVGLGNVDNTTDAGKPVSTAQQTALDLKAPLASPTFTGPATLTEAAAPGTPASGKVALYAKTDGLLYSKDDAGAETPLGGAAAAAWANYTPTVTPSSGSFTTLGTVLGRSIKIGKLRIVVVNIPITTNGTASGVIQCTLPENAVVSLIQAGTGTRYSDFKGLSLIIADVNRVDIRLYDGSYPGADGVTLWASIVYEVA